MSRYYPRVVVQSFTFSSVAVGSLVEQVIAMPSSGVAKVLGVKIEVPAISTATTGLHGVGIGWKNVDKRIEGLVIEGDTTADLGYSTGYRGHPDDTYFVGGDESLCIGSADHPLNVYYSLGGDVDQAGTISIEVVLIEGE